MLNLWETIGVRWVGNLEEWILVAIWEKEKDLGSKQSKEQELGSLHSPEGLYLQ